MSIDAQKLYDLLPAVYRIRDAKQGGALKALMGVLAEQATVLESDLERLYDDQFIETCSEWVVPYIGDLLQVKGLHGFTTTAFSQRARVANTIRYRRRKGTATMLEQLARDTTGWNARAVEFFKLLGTTQNMNHVRPENYRTPDIRQGRGMELLDTPFDTIPHTADVRRISSRSGKHNIPNVGLFLWRLQAYPLTQSPAVAVDKHRFFIGPLGCSLQLFTHPVTENQITHLADFLNVPDPISRFRLDDHLSDYYGQRRSILIEDDNGPIAESDLSVCNLADVDPKDPSKGWAHIPPKTKIAIDPVMGRLAFRDPPMGTPRASFYYGFSADLGGGEYDRTTSVSAALTPAVKVPADQATVQAAVNQVANGGAVEVQNSGRYAEPGLTITVNAHHRVEVRSVNERRATLVLTNDLKSPQDLTITGGDAAELILNGLLIIGGTLKVSGRLMKLTLRHCTLVPGLSVDQAGKTMNPGTPSLSTKTDADLTTTVEIDRCITGPLNLADNVNVIVRDSILDGMGGALKVVTGNIATIERSTIIGASSVKQLDLGNSTIFTQTVTVQRRQVGCMRFCYVPDGSRTPRRYRCQPDLALDQRAKDLNKDSAADLPASERVFVLARVMPAFTSIHYGDPGYGQLSITCSKEICTGAEDESEMGAFSFLKQPQREANLLSSLDEYLRFGLEAGVFYVT
jgi:hypothetical protein